MAKKPIPAKHLDLRTSARYIESGDLAKSDYEAHMNALPDLADQAEDISGLVYPENHKADA